MVEYFSILLPSLCADSKSRFGIPSLSLRASILQRLGNCLILEVAELGQCPQSRKSHSECYALTNWPKGPSILSCRCAERVWNFGFVLAPSPFRLFARCLHFSVLYKPHVLLPECRRPAAEDEQNLLHSSFYTPTSLPLEGSQPRSPSRLCLCTDVQFAPWVGTWYRNSCELWLFM